jgi:hypothetical protein
MYEWFENGKRALERENLFEAFIYLWISWVVACKVHRGNNYAVTPNLEDSKVVAAWAESESREVSEIIEEQLVNLRPLGNRRGSSHGNYIVDSSVRLQERFSRLSKYFRDEHVYEDKRQLASDFAELVNKVRNNLFHGGKLYSSSDDRELLSAILPALKEITNYAVDTTRR